MECKNRPILETRIIEEAAEYLALRHLKYAYNHTLLEGDWPPQLELKIAKAIEMLEEHLTASGK